MNLNTNFKVFKFCCAYSNTLKLSNVLSVFSSVEILRTASTFRGKEKKKLVVVFVRSFTSSINGVYGNFTRCYCFFDVLMKIVVVVAKAH